MIVFVVGAGRRVAARQRARYRAARTRFRAAAQCPVGGSARSVAVCRGYAAAARNPVCCTYPARRSHHRRSCRRAALYSRSRFGYVTCCVWLVVVLSARTVYDARE